MKIAAIFIAIFLFPFVLYILGAIYARAKMTVFEQSRFGQLVMTYLEQQLK